MKTLTTATQAGNSRMIQSQNVTTSSSTSPIRLPVQATQRGKARLRRPNVAVENRKTAAARVANPKSSV